MSNWIQKTGVSKHRGALHKQLGIPETEKIPIGVLSKVAHAAAGRTIKVGKKSVKVTPQLKHRANFALEMKRL